MSTNKPKIVAQFLDEIEAASESWGPQRMTRGRRDVVTAFVRRPSDSSVLLVKRSEKVNTYKLHWGGVSGVVEGNENLQERAKQEILEEVGFASDQLHFIRTGRPLYVDDHSGKLYFAVHPFLFDLTTAEDSDCIQPKLNWENVDAKFVAPESLKASSLVQPLVPQLPETLDRVVLPPHQEAVLEKIKKDREHGAAQLAVLVLDALEEEIHHFKQQNSRGNKSNEEDDNNGGPTFIEHLCNFGYHLSCCRPSMAPLATTVAHVFSSVHQSLHQMASPFDVTVEEVCLVAVHAVQKERDYLKSLQSRLLAHSLELINDTTTIMTLSKSSSVSAVINEALKRGKRLKIIVCESRPLCEGVVAAQNWADLGVEVIVITDAQMAVFVKHADIVLVGADAVDSEQGVYNKVGTHLLALAAKEAKVPLYALADSSKIYPGPVEKLAHPGEGLGEDLGEEKAVEEVVKGWGRSKEEGGENFRVPAPFVVRNVYFEATPLDLVTAVVTEDGVMDAEAVGKEIERVKEVYIEAFQLQI